MKYFTDITTPEELKKEFRTLSIKLHPDRGGNAEEFKAMLSEYESICKNFDSIKERQEAEREAEEARKEWERQEAERKAQEEKEAREAAEALRPIIAKWSKILERVPAAPDYRSTAKEKAAYSAAVKRNLKAVFAHYFPGVNVKISRSTEIWKEKTVISWVDGPTLAEVKALDVWEYFQANSWYSDPYADYGHHVEIKGTKAWREAFGESYEAIKFDRDFSEVAKGAMLRTIWATIPTFDGCKAGSDEKPVTLDDLHRLYNVCYPDAPTWRNDMTEEEQHEYYKFSDIESRFTRLITYYSYNKTEQYLDSIISLMCDHWAVPADVAKEAKAEAEKPVFTPVWGKTVKAINKAIGSGCELAIKRGRGVYDRVNLLEALEAVTRGEVVNVVSWSFWEHSQQWNAWAKNSGGRKPHAKRKEKFNAVGLSLLDVLSTFNAITVIGVNAETLEAVRREFADVEQQRKEWEQAQSEPKADTKTAASSAQGETLAEGEILAEADGVTLTASAKGAEFSGNTYAHKSEIKAMGGRWYRLGQCWTIKADKIAEAVAMVNGWNTTTDNEPQSEPTATADTLHDAEEISAEPTAADTLTRSEMVEVVAIAKYFGAVDWFTDCTLTDGGIVEVLADDPEALHRWDKSGRPLNRCACVKMYGEEITKEGETLHTVADHHAHYTENGDNFAEWWEALTALHDADEISEEQTADTVTDEQTAEAVTDEQTAEAVAGVVVAFVDICQALEDVAKAQRAEAERTAKATAKAEEIETLRQSIATLSAQLATMSDQLRTMSDRLAELTADTTTEAEAPTGATATAEDAGTTLHPEEVEGLRYDFKQAAEEADRLTDENEHTKAVITCGKALFSRGNFELFPQVQRLLKALEELDDLNEKQGYLTMADKGNRDAMQDQLTELTVKYYGVELAVILWGKHQALKIAEHMGKKTA